MQWLDAFFKNLFKLNAFKIRYRTKSGKKFLKYLNNSKWQIIDIRNPVEYSESCIKGTINISSLFFNISYYKKISRSKKILLINRDFHSNLNIYNFLNKKRFKVYILHKNFYDLILDPEINKITKTIMY